MSEDAVSTGDPAPSTDPVVDHGERHRLVTILSPKGGAGKTTVSTNLAVTLAKHHPRDVVIVDLDLQFGDVANNLRLSPKATIVDVCRRWPVDTAQLKLALTAHPTGLYALCSPINPAEADEVQAEHVTGILRQLSRSFRYVVVDTDPGLSERVLSAVDVSTDIVMVCSTEIPSIRGLRKAVEALDIVGLTTANRTFMLNRANAKVGIDVADIERTVGCTIDIRLPSSIDMVLATNDGVPITESGKNPALMDPFNELAARLDGAGAVRRDGDGRAGARRFKRRG